MATNEILSSLFKQEQAERETRLATDPSIREKLDTTAPAITTSPASIGEIFSAAFDVGVDQLEGDVNRAKAIGNLLVGNDAAAKRNLQKAQFDDDEAARVLEGLAGFDQFLEEPTFDGFSEQVTKSIGQFTPLALTSVASGFTGALVGLLGRGAFTASSRAGMKELFSGALKKKSLQQTLSPEEKVILDGAYSVSRFAKGGAIVGAFGHEQLIGSSQAVAEFQDAGREITADEAAAATALGVPQAILGTLSESLFASSLLKLSFRKSRLGAVQQKQATGRKLIGEEERLLAISAKRQRGEFLTKAEDDIYRASINPGPYFGNLMKDVANATAASSVAEGVTELGLEEILIQQRKNLDPEYSDQEAALRRAESAFAGFFAGGARSAVASPVSSVFNTARQQLQNVRENQVYANLREERYLILI